MSEEITPGEGSPMPVVQGHFIALGARQKAKDKGPEFEGEGPKARGQGSGHGARG